jgi:hypothetical protein
MQEVLPAKPSISNPQKSFQKFFGKSFLAKLA